MLRRFPMFSRLVFVAVSSFTLLSSLAAVASRLPESPNGIPPVKLREPYSPPGAPQTPAAESLLQPDHDKGFFGDGDGIYICGTWVKNM